MGEGECEMRSLYHSYNMLVDKAYIIQVKGNEKSERLARRCAKSCEDIRMSYTFWDGYDGVSGNLKAPDHLKNHTVMNMIRISDHFMRKGEVGNFLSHVSLWSKCVEQDQPLVILEHDAIMVRKYPVHTMYNSICYLGSDEQYNRGWKTHLTPLHGTMGPNYHFICRSHAYSIDPAVARHLLSHVLRYGVSSSIDTFMRADIFPIHQNGVYAYDKPEEPIIENRMEGRPNDRNDYLEK